jgi:hypothetical protein
VESIKLEDCSSGQPGKKQNPISREKGTEGMANEVEFLSSKHEALSSNPSTAKTKHNKKQMKHLLKMDM